MEILPKNVIIIYTTKNHGDVVVFCDILCAILSADMKSSLYIVVQIIIYDSYEFCFYFYIKHIKY